MPIDMIDFGEAERMVEKNLYRVSFGEAEKRSATRYVMAEIIMIESWHKKLTSNRFLLSLCDIVGNKRHAYTIYLTLNIK